MQVTASSPFRHPCSTPLGSSVGVHGSFMMYPSDPRIHQVVKPLATPHESRVRRCVGTAV